MAISPCSLCGQRFLGRATYFYPAVLRGAEADRQVLRLCPHHAKNLQANLHDRCSLNADTGIFEPIHVEECLICKAPVGLSQATVYVTCYPTKDERQDFWGFGCAKCLARDLLAVVDDKPPSRAET